MTETIHEDALRVGEGTTCFFLAINGSLKDTINPGCIDLGKIVHHGAVLHDGSQVYTFRKSSFGNHILTQRLDFLTYVTNLECLGGLAIGGEYISVDKDCATLFPEALKFQES